MCGRRDGARCGNISMPVLCAFLAVPVNLISIFSNGETEESRRELYLLLPPVLFAIAFGSFAFLVPVIALGLRVLGASLAVAQQFCDDPLLLCGVCATVFSAELFTNVDECSSITRVPTIFMTWSFQNHGVI